MMCAPGRHQFIWSAYGAYEPEPVGVSAVRTRWSKPARSCGESEPTSAPQGVGMMSEPEGLVVIEVFKNGHWWIYEHMSIEAREGVSLALDDPNVRMRRFVPEDDRDALAERVRELEAALSVAHGRAISAGDWEHAEEYKSALAASSQPEAGAAVCRCRHPLSDHGDGGCLFEHGIGAICSCLTFEAGAAVEA